MENENCSNCLHKMEMIYGDERKDYDLWGNLTDSIDIIIYWCNNCGSVLIINHGNKEVKTRL